MRVDGFLLQTSRQTPEVGQTPSIGVRSSSTARSSRASRRAPRVTPRLAVLGAAGVYSQPPDPADLSAVFGNPTLGPETADHASLGESLQLTPALSLETLGFYKWMSGLTVRNPSPTPALAQALRAAGSRAASTACRRCCGSSPGMGSSAGSAYTLSRSERQDTPGAATASSTTTSRTS